jgi:K+-transporting ATPase KdpF subunit
MTFEYTLSALAALLLIVYLFRALLFPEKV